MDGNQSRMLAEIQAAILDGSLTKDEIERRLDAAVDREIYRTDRPADMELVNACEGLLWELNAPGHAPFESHMAENMAAVQEKLKVWQRRKRIRRIALRSVAAAAAVLVLAFGIDAVVKHSWLQGESTPDEQQYAITGHEVDPGIVGTSEASEESRPQSITTTNYGEVAAMLGYSPAQPQWVPKGWLTESYYGRITNVSTTFRVVYLSSRSDDLLRFMATSFTDSSRAIAELEQNQVGEAIQCRGLDVYVSENSDSTIGIWREGLTCYTITGQITQQDLIHMIESIKE